MRAFFLQNTELLQPECFLKKKLYENINKKAQGFDTVGISYFVMVKRGI